MDPSMYGAAMDGKEEFLDGINHINQDYLITAPNGNTILHIATQYGKDEWIQKLFSSTMDPLLLSKLLRAENNKREKAIHVVAREGHPKVIRALIQHAQSLDGAVNDFSALRDLLTSRNEDEDSALHIALRALPIRPTETETVLYLATECKSYQLVGKIAVTVPSDEASPLIMVIPMVEHLCKLPSSVMKKVDYAI